MYFSLQFRSSLDVFCWARETEHKPTVKCCKSNPRHRAIIDPSSTEDQNSGLHKDGPIRPEPRPRAVIYSLFISGCGAAPCGRNAAVFQERLAQRRHRQLLLFRVLGPKPRLFWRLGCGEKKNKKRKKWTFFGIKPVLSLHWSWSWMYFEKMSTFLKLREKRTSLLETAHANLGQSGASRTLREPAEEVCLAVRNRGSCLRKRTLRNYSNNMVITVIIMIIMTLTSPQMRAQRRHGACTAPQRDTLRTLHTGSTRDPHVTHTLHTLHTGSTRSTRSTRLHHISMSSEWLELVLRKFWLDKRLLREETSLVISFFFFPNFVYFGLYKINQNTQLHKGNSKVKMYTSTILMQK